MDDNGDVVGSGDAGAQARFIFQKIDRALTDAGASLSDVIRTRMFVTNIEDWESVSAAHNEAFHNVRPAATMVQVSALIDADMLVEIEVEAELSGERP